MIGWFNVKMMCLQHGNMSNIYSDLNTSQDIIHNKHLKIVHLNPRYLSQFYIHSDQ